MAKKDSQRIAEIREKANLQRRAQQKAEKRKTIIIQASIGVGILILVAAVVGGILIANNNKATVVPPSADGTITVSGTAGIPLTVGDTSVTVGKSNAPVTLDIYEDYSCPHCADYEAAVGPTILRLIASGEVVVSYHPIQIVTSYGVAAGSAAACVAEKDAQNWPIFHSALFANHSQTSDGWGASDFAAFASTLGVTDADTLSCISDASYSDWIRSNTDAARADGVSSTPSLFINGEAQASPLGVDDLIAAVNAAKG
ncbi:MAG: thioredoxin domain-containing protein [Parvibaculum sp.]|nr:thioredoxin domain-containing protein [Cryobacterium sp.]MBX3505904.1 thioredoxin domain-containing protein [Parvibaculum sp.]HNP15058.1 thioredoxin domain-containing protein [Terrimesophilobacter sp.]